MNRSRVHRRPLVRPLPLAAVATIAALLGTAIVAAPAVATPSTQAGRTVSDPARYVDPFIGTSNNGNTWPGATAPDVAEGVFVGPALRRGDRRLHVVPVRGTATDPVFRQRVRTFVDEVAARTVV